MSYERFLKESIFAWKAGVHHSLLIYNVPHTGGAINTICDLVKQAGLAQLHLEAGRIKTTVARNLPTEEVVIVFDGEPTNSEEWMVYIQAAQRGRTIVLFRNDLDTYTIYTKILMSHCIITRYSD